MNRTLALPSWREAQSAHKIRAGALTLGRRDRKQIGERDPVDDFMFEYYPYTPTKLETWFPGVGTTLEINSSDSFDFPNYNSNGATCELDDQYLIKHRSRIDSTLELLRNTQLREATFNCFGLHEWAMVYQADQNDIRHGDPLRVDQDQIDSLISELGLRCTHIDAFRFFTDEAAPQNVNRLNIIPTRDNQKDIEQSGCLHANMDLYKHCMWFHPMIPGELVLDCFELARSARTLDMQASPYDLTQYGYEPIMIEASAGRATYVARQRAISLRARGLRSQLIAALETACNPAL
jgi:hypothetical protein